MRGHLYAPVLNFLGRVRTLAERVALVEGGLERKLGARREGEL
jgi:hypothetical protein